MQLLSTATLACALTAAPALAQTSGASETFLVYNQNAVHDFAETAAESLFPGQVTVAGSADFNSLLTSQSWTAVIVDCPGSIPSTGWQPLVDYVDGGGIAILSFWDWDDPNDAVLLAPFDVSSPVTISLSSQTLTDLGTSAIFEGVTNPYSEWDNHFGDDGDQFTPINGAIGLAHLGVPSRPAIVLGNQGRTIATFLLDEAGPTWQGDGSGVNIWKNMIELVMDRDPAFEVTDFLPGQFMTLSVSLLPFGSNVHFVVSSIGPGPTPTPFGILEVSQPWRRTPPFPADADGTFSFTSTLPAGASGSTFYMQAVVFEAGGEVRFSNPVQQPIP